MRSGGRSPGTRSSWRTGWRAGGAEPMRPWCADWLERFGESLSDRRSRAERAARPPKGGPGRRPPNPEFLARAEPDHSGDTVVVRNEDAPAGGATAREMPAGRDVPGAGNNDEPGGSERSVAATREGGALLLRSPGTVIRFVGSVPTSRWIQHRHGIVPVRASPRSPASDYGAVRAGHVRFCSPGAEAPVVLCSAHEQRARRRPGAVVSGGTRWNIPRLCSARRTGSSTQARLRPLPRLACLAEFQAERPSS